MALTKKDLERLLWCFDNPISFGRPDSASLFAGDDLPDGVLTLAKGSIYIHHGSPPSIWQNTDGGSVWTQVSAGAAVPVSWGAITGTLSAQGDLATALSDAVTNAIADAQAALAGHVADINAHPQYLPNPRHFIRADVDRTFASSTSPQAIFNAPANGRVTLDAGLYAVEAVLHIRAMAINPGNLLLNLRGAGTAIAGSWMWWLGGIDAVGGVTGAGGQAGIVTSSSPAAAVPAANNSAVTLHAKGTFEVTTAGTLIPSISLANAAAAILTAGSFLSLERLGNTTVTSIGQWD